MASTAPLKGSELIDCAKANGSKGIEVAASRCGYGSDLAAFESALQDAGRHIGVDIRHFEDLANPSQVKPEAEVEFAPDSSSQF